jgi:hypothetical protein
MLRPQPELLSENQLEIFLVVAFVLCMPNGMPFLQKEKVQLNETNAGQGF